VTKQGNPHGEPDAPADHDAPPDHDEGTISDRFAYRAFLRTNRAMDLTYRITVGLVGLTIIVIGIILLPLPGPGWLIIFGGLFVLSTEFEWAERLLEYARDKVHAWTEWVKEQSLLIRAVIGLGCLLIVAGALWGYVAWKGIPDWIPLIG
jgi:uncharacterized protein (TIGR02611 family)